MSLTNANLAGVLSVRGRLSADGAARLREQWRRAHSGANGMKMVILERGQEFKPAPLDGDLYALICRAQDRFRPPHDRWQWAHGMPIPFRWGPNGALFLLLGMLAAYGCAIALWGLL